MQHNFFIFFLLSSAVNSEYWRKGNIDSAIGYSNSIIFFATSVSYPKSSIIKAALGEKIVSSSEDAKSSTIKSVYRSLS